jgi:hypothetical protein
MKLILNNLGLLRIDNEESGVERSLDRSNPVQSDLCIHGSLPGGDFGWLVVTGM